VKEQLAVWHAEGSTLQPADDWRTRMDSQGPLQYWCRDEWLDAVSDNSSNSGLSFCCFPPLPGLQGHLCNAWI